MALSDDFERLDRLVGGPKGYSPEARNALGRLIDKLRTRWAPEDRGAGRPPGQRNPNFDAEPLDVATFYRDLLHAGAIKADAIRETKHYFHSPASYSDKSAGKTLDRWLAEFFPPNPL